MYLYGNVMLIDSGGKEISVYRYENTGFAVSKKR